MFCSVFLFFCFKQKTAYEMRISDWSSDVCSSDREWRESFGTESSGRIASRQVQAERAEARASLAVYFAVSGVVFALIAGWSMLEQVPARLIGNIGRASCRERVCQDV